jgi:hypothetical protein
VASPAELAGPSLERRAWLVPFAICLSVIFGALLSATIDVIVPTSGIVQSTLSTPIPNQLSTGVVLWLFGTPFAVLAAAVISYAGLFRPRAWLYTVVGVAIGATVFAGISVNAVGIGDWWIAQVPTDTNRAAALLTAILAPPGILALLLGSTSARVGRSPQWGGPLMRFLWAGVELGIVLGALIGGCSAVITWSLTCPQNGSGCFTVSGVLSSGLFVGGVEGAALGAVCGYIAWTVRPRASSQPSAVGIDESHAPA